ncbi:MAG: hypothetical protein ACT443_08085 [Gemmatimonadota bacterium]
MRARAGDGTSPAWYSAGAALVLLIGVALWPVLTDSRATDAGDRIPIEQMQEDMAGQPGSPPPLTGTPREQADRLFNRVMTEQANGDTARAQFFLPMAIQAYRMAADLDADGLYHLGLLQAIARDYAGARASAERMLAAAPNHLLGLAAAANASRAAGDTAAARAYYQRFLAAHATESKRDLPEYRDHGRAFPDLRAEADAFINR